MPCRIFLDKALALVDFERKIISLRLEHPEIMAGVQEITSPLYWSQEHTQIDLMELACALYALHVLRTIDGSPADLTLIATFLSRLFHVQLSDPNKKKWLVLNRKNKLTHFMDCLKTALIDLSQM